MKKAASFILIALMFAYAFFIGMAKAMVHRKDLNHQKNFNQLKKDVESCPFHADEYVMDKFDCSNMAGLMVDTLDAKGYNAEIVIGHSRLDRSCKHAFVIVDRQAIVEARFKSITFSEGKYGNSGNIQWYIDTWDIIGVYADKHDAARRSQWGILEFDTTFRDLLK